MSPLSLSLIVFSNVIGFGVWSIESNINILCIEIPTTIFSTGKTYRPLICSSVFESLELITYILLVMRWILTILRIPN